VLSYSCTVSEACCAAVATTASQATPPAAKAHLLELHDVWVHQTSVIEDLAFYVLGDLLDSGSRGQVQVQLNAWPDPLGLFEGPGAPRALAIV
jgi:hypothetical protein